MKFKEKVKSTREKIEGILEGAAYAVKFNAIVAILLSMISERIQELGVEDIPEEIFFSAFYLKQAAGVIASIIEEKEKLND